MRKLAIAPEHTWLTIFIPALLYYIFLSNTNTHLHSSSPNLFKYLGLIPNNDYFGISHIPAYLTTATGNNTNIVTINVTVTAKQKKMQSLFMTQNSSFEIVIPSSSSSSASSSSSSSASDSTETKTTKNANTKLVSSLWMEDVDLGRGYLLLSDKSKHGSIWRYEVGGGPIPIGKSLYMDYSGCRSNYWNTCEDENDSSSTISTISSSSSSSSDVGSMGMTIQIEKDETDFMNGLLVISEKGEQRIVRLEKDGSRTPLVLNVTSLCHADEVGYDDDDDDDESDSDGHRLIHSNQVLYTPFGDLLFTDYNPNGCPTTSSSSSSSSSSNSSEGQEAVAGVYKLKEIINIPQLSSFQQSKEAHKWTEEELNSYYINHHHGHDKLKSTTTSTMTTSPYHNMDLLYSGAFEYISGMIIGQDLTSLYIAGKMKHDETDHVQYGIVKVSIEEEEEGEEDEQKEKEYKLIHDLDDDEDDDDDDEHEHEHEHESLSDKNENQQNHNEPQNGSGRKNGILDDKSILFHDMTHYFSTTTTTTTTLSSSSIGIALTMDENGLLYATYPNGIAIIDSLDGILLGTLSFQNHNFSSSNSGADAGVDVGAGVSISDDTSKSENGLNCQSQNQNECKNEYNKNDWLIIPNSITIGKDQYMYVTSQDIGLMKLKTKTKPFMYPTNLIVPTRRIK